jgi:hypothetical protein
MFSLRRPASCLLLASCFIACGAPEPELADEVDSATSDLKTTYGDLMETLSEPDIERWMNVRRALIDGFDRICGDTICGGDFPNLSTIELQCSSTTKARKLKDCTWILGGSTGYVEGDTGAMAGESRVFTCKIPVRGTAPTLLNVLSAAGDDALNTPLPLTKSSFYDGLLACFDGVVGPARPYTEEPAFVELADYYWSQGDEQGLAWVETRQKLRQDFDDICGDSFCEGDFSDITALGLICSVEQASGHVSSCQWAFGAANTSVSSKGAIDVDTDVFQCPIEVNASASELAAALSGENPLHAPLPGTTSSLYDSLIGCL